MEITSFESWLIRNGRQLVTARRHQKNIGYINKHISEWSVENLDAFIVGLKSTGYRNASLNCLIDSIRVWSQYNNLDPKLQNYKHFKKEYSIKQTFSDDEIEMFLKLDPPPQADKIVWERDTLFYSVLAFTGMRCGEVCNLRKIDLNFQTNLILIQHTKTGRPRFVPIPPNIREKLYQHWVKCGDYVFVTRTGRVYSDANYQHSFEKRVNILGIKRPFLTPYSFRHSMATALLTQDVNIHKIAKLLGHNVKQTITYEHLVTKDITECIKKHPLIRKQSAPKEVLLQVRRMVDSFCLNDDSRFVYTVVETEHGIEFRVVIREPVLLTS